MFEILPGVIAVPVMIAIIELLKMIGFNQKYAPLAALFLGQAFALAKQFYGQTEIYTSIVMGLLIALSSIGLYSGAKNTAEMFRQKS